MTSRGAFIVMLAAALALPQGQAHVQEQTGPSTGEVRIEYAAPKEAAHQEAYDRLKQAQVLERLRDLLAPLRLPASLLLRTEGCDGEVNAWYYDRVVQVCYEYIAQLIRVAPQQMTPEGVTPDDAIIGPTIEVFLHEIGHAVFDLLEVPIFGREEDAADQFAAFVLLQFGEEDVRRAIRGIAHMLAQWAKDSTPELKDFADVHGTPAQRFFNLLCLAYGAHPKLFADVVERGHLPQSRAEGCADEYQQIMRAFERLIAPHVDPQLRDKVRSEIRSRPLLHREPGAEVGSTGNQGHQ